MAQSRRTPDGYLLFAFQHEKGNRLQMRKHLQPICYVRIGNSVSLELADMGRHGGHRRLSCRMQHFCMA